MTSQLRLALVISADAKGVVPATAETRREVNAVEDAAVNAGRAISAANDAAAASARRATEATRGQAAAERDLRSAVERFAGVRSPLNDNQVRQRAQDVAFYGAELDRLRAKYNPLFAEIQRYKTAQSEIRDAHRLGAISIDEMAAALSRERQAALASIAALKGRQAVAGATSFGGAGAFQTANIGAQFQDIAVTSAMGMSPLQIGLQQGTQLALITSQLGTGMEAAKGFAAALASVFSPVSLITIGLTAAAAAAIQFFTSSTQEAKTTDQALDDHKEAILALGKAYGTVAVQAEDFDRRSQIVLEAAVRRAREAAEAAALREQAAVVDAFGGARVRGGGYSSIFPVASEFAAFAEPIAKLRDEIRSGKPDFEAFQQELDEIAKSDPGNLQAIADRILDIADAAMRAREQLELTQPLLSGPVPGPGAMERAQEQYDATFTMWRRFGYDDDSGIDPNKPKKAKTPRAPKADPYRDLIKSADDRIAQMRTEIELTGRVGVEAEALRYEQELLSQATDKGRTIGVAQRAEIRARAEEYGRLKVELAATRLEQDLLFEREQMFRSPAEQRVASSLRGAGLDPNSTEGRDAAEQIRLNEALSNGKQLAVDFLMPFTQVRSLADAVDVLRSSVDRLMSKLLEMALNAAINAFFANLAGAFGGSFAPNTSLTSELTGDPWAGLRSANGNVFDGISRFGLGSTFANTIVTKPTLFSFARGTRLGEMGEAGPEAILPLSRDSSGRLGVHAAMAGASGGMKVVINNYAQAAVETRQLDDDTLEVTVRALAREEAGKIMDRSLGPSLQSGYGVNPQIPAAF